MYKLVQKHTYTFLSHRYGMVLIFTGLIIIVVSAFHFGESSLEWSRDQYSQLFNIYHDNIAGKAFQNRMCLPIPIDAVYTWVNGSDPKLIADLQRVKERIEKETKKETKEDAKDSIQCKDDNCIPGRMIVFSKMLPSNVQNDDLAQSHIAFLQGDRVFNLTKSSRENVTVAQFEKQSVVDTIMKEMPYIIYKGRNISLSKGYLTSDWQAEGGIEVSDLAFVSGVGKNVTKEEVRMKIPEEQRENVKQIDLTSSAGVVIITLKTPDVTKTFITEFEKSEGEEGMKVGAAYLLWGLERDESNHEEDVSRSRFEDNEEMRYSLRSLEQNAPWIRHVYIVTNGQIPSWLNLDNPRITLVTHEDIFPNKSHLPTFSSPAIESNLHRIPGLSNKFIYLNDDTMFGVPVWPDDFYTHSRGQKIYLTWPVPNCAEGCPASWILDNYCDTACNNSECDWDGGDCDGVTKPGPVGGVGGGQLDFPDLYCNPGCANGWIADRYCDQTCNIAKCGFDAGDCGADKFNQLYGVDIKGPVNITIPQGITVFFLNLTTVFGANSSITEAQYEDSKIVRTATVAQKYKLIMMLLHENVTETLIGITVFGEQLMDKTPLNVTFNITVNSVPIAERALTIVNAVEGLEKPVVAGDNETSRVVFSDIPEHERGPKVHPKVVQAVELPNIDDQLLTKDVALKLAELDKKLSDGDITEKGYNRHKAELLQDYLQSPEYANEFAKKQWGGVQGGAGEPKEGIDSPKLSKDEKSLDKPKSGRTDGEDAEESLDRFKKMKFRGGDFRQDSKDERGRGEAGRDERNADQFDQNRAEDTRINIERDALLKPLEQVNQKQLLHQQQQQPAPQLQQGLLGVPFQQVNQDQQPLNQRQLPFMHQQQQRQPSGPLQQGIQQLQQQQQQPVPQQHQLNQQQNQLNQQPQSPVQQQPQSPVQQQQEQRQPGIPLQQVNQQQEPLMQQKKKGPPDIQFQPMNQQFDQQTVLQQQQQQQQPDTKNQHVNQHLDQQQQQPYQQQQPLQHQLPELDHQQHQNEQQQQFYPKGQWQPEVQLQKLNKQQLPLQQQQQPNQQDQDVIQQQLPLKQQQQLPVLQEQPAKVQEPRFQQQQLDLQQKQPIQKQPDIPQEQEQQLDIQQQQPNQQQPLVENKHLELQKLQHQQQPVTVESKIDNNKMPDDSSENSKFAGAGGGELPPKQNSMNNLNYHGNNRNLHDDRRREADGERFGAHINPQRPPNIHDLQPILFNKLPPKQDGLKQQQQVEQRRRQNWREPVLINQQPLAQKGLYQQANSKIPDTNNQHFGDGNQLPLQQDRVNRFRQNEQRLPVGKDTRPVEKMQKQGDASKRKLPLDVNQAGQNQPAPAQAGQNQFRAGQFDQQFVPQDDDQKRIVDSNTPRKKFHKRRRKETVRKFMDQNEDRNPGSRKLLSEEIYQLVTEDHHSNNSLPAEMSYLTSTHITSTLFSNSKSSASGELPSNREHPGIGQKQPGKYFVKMRISAADDDSIYKKPLKRSEKNLTPKRKEEDAVAVAMADVTDEEAERLIEDADKYMRRTSFLPWERTDKFGTLSKEKERQQRTSDYQVSNYKSRRTLDTFADSLIHVNRLYNHRFGFISRKVPGHIPHMIDVKVMEELQAEFPAEFNETSSHQIRHSKDMQFAFSYMYYIIGSPKEVNTNEIFDEFDTDHSGVLSDREIRTLATRLFELPLDLQTLSSLENNLIQCAKNLSKVVYEDPSLTQEKYYEEKMPQVTKALVAKCPSVTNLMKQSVKGQTNYKHEILDDEDIAFKMIRTNVSQVIGQLDDIRKNPKKFVCLNDNIDHTSPDAYMVKAVLQDFYEALFPIVSQFELPREYRNRFLHVDELRDWRRYRDWLRFWTQLSLCALIVFSIASFCSHQLMALRRRCCPRRRTKMDEIAERVQHV